MIPFRDTNPSGTVPYVTVALIILNVLVFLHEANRPPEQLEPFAERYGLRPAYVTAFIRSPEKMGPYFAPIFLPFLTSMFLHGGLMHLLGNMLYLWIFGDNVEDRLGHVKFLIFYLLCGIMASWAHVLLNPNSAVPTVGASGAIAGVLGAYLLAFPRAQVDTLVFLGIFITVIRLPAFVVLGLWALLQYVGGLQSLRMQANMGGVAWWAHVGGFACGLLLLPLLQKPPEKRRAYVQYRR